MGKISSAILLSIFLLILELGICCLARNTTFSCIEGERKALLRLRASVFDPSNRLSSWNWKNKEYCCAWQGVKCNKITGHVIKLDLSNSKTTIDNMLQSKMVDSSLLELKYLSYLDLSWNDFEGSKIPAFLGSMKHLQHLDLSNANFGGIVPHHLGNLSSLHTLDLSGRGSLIVADLMWAINLSSLEFLDMSYVDLSSTKDIVIKVLQMLPSLVVLRMSSSALDKTHLPLACVNSTLLTNVHSLDLSSNSLDGEFPCFLQNMTSLRFLDLSNNMFNFSGTTHLLGLKNLAHLNLAYNWLEHKADWMSGFLWGKCHLKSLNLEGNQFYGDISEPFKNLSRCWSHNLESLTLALNEFDGHLAEELSELKQLMYLDLSFNLFSGPIPTSLGKLSALTELHISDNSLSRPIPSSLGNLSALTELHLSSNSLSGPIPYSLGNLRSLRVLSLDRNQLGGQIPISLGQLSNLESIDISFNSFKATLLEAHFAKLSKLEYLWTIFSMLKFGVGNHWVPPFQLKHLNMGSSKIGGQFPEWLQTQKALILLDLSNCSITGTLPKRLHSMNWTEVYLSHNNITGPIPELASSATILDISGNMITHLPSTIGHTIPLVQILLLSRNFINGSLPDSLCEMKALTILDLSKNHLSGNLPDCWSNLQQLQVARLQSNELSGVIPNSLGGTYSLKWLHLNDNNLMGKLPSTLKNCTRLKVLDVGGNSLSGKLPEWIGKDVLDLKVLRVRDNEFYGTIPSVFCQLLLLQVMDLANNKLTGNIPHCFGNFSGMIKREWRGDYGVHYDDQRFYESLSQVLKGMELEYTRNSRYVVNLDLSSNHLVGEIPSELTSLSGLLGLNLSHNRLGGEIPAKIGELESLESLDLSSNNLFGMIPDSLSNMSSLSHLNLSHNNLSGQIHTGPQLQTLDDPSIYDGNPELCGAPLLKKCHNNEAPIAPDDENHEAADDDTTDKIYFYAVIIAGFATGFWGFIGVLVFKTKWRQAYFKFIDVVLDKMLGY